MPIFISSEGNIGNNFKNPVKGFLTDLDQTEFHDNKTKTDQINVEKVYYALNLFFLASYYGK